MVEGRAFDGHTKEVAIRMKDRGKLTYAGLAWPADQSWPRSSSQPSSAICLASSLLMRSNNVH